MNATHEPHTAATDLNHLRRGRIYRLITKAGATIDGEYLGIEVMYDDWCLLLRGTDETHSIPTRHVNRVEVPMQAA